MSRTCQALRWSPGDAGSALTQEELPDAALPGLHASRHRDGARSRSRSCTRPAPGQSSRVAPIARTALGVHDARWQTACRVRSGEPPGRSVTARARGSSLVSGNPTGSPGSAVERRSRERRHGFDSRGQLQQDRLCNSNNNCVTQSAERTGDEVRPRASSVPARSGPPHGFRCFPVLLAGGPLAGSLT